MQLPLPQTVGWPGGPQFQTFGLFLLAAVLAGYALDREERRDARWLAGLAGALLAGRLLRQAVFPDLAWNDPRSWLRLTGDAFSYEGALGGFLAGQAALAGGDWRGRLRALEGLALPLAAASALAMPAWPVEGIRSRLLALPDPAGQPALAVQLIGALAYAVLALSLAGRRRGAPGSMGVFLAASGLVRFALDWGVTGRTPWWGPLSAVQVEALAGFLAGVAWLLASGRPADLLERMRLPVEGLAALLLLAALVTVAASGAGRAGTAAAGGGGGSSGGAAATPAVELPPAPLPGYPAPDFTLQALDGSTFRLSQLRGKPVLLNFWASWCPPCRAEMPEIQRFQRQYGDRVAVVGVDMQEDAQAVRAFVRQAGYGWRFLLDPSLQVAQRYGVGGIPTSFWIDARGVVRVRFVGPMTFSQMQAYLKEVESAAAR